MFAWCVQKKAPTIAVDGDNPSKHLIRRKPAIWLQHGVSLEQKPRLAFVRMGSRHTMDEQLPLDGIN